MNAAFTLAAVVAVAATAIGLTRSNAVHALLYIVVSLFATALAFFVLGAPFVAALEVIVYAGAIMVLFVFVVMLVRLGPESAQEERGLMAPKAWIGPALLSLVLAVVLAILLSKGDATDLAGVTIPSREVGETLLGPYLLGVELSSMLLLAALVGAWHLGRRRT